MYRKTLPRKPEQLKEESTSRVNFVFPYKTLKVSVTGQQCTSNCAHCGGYYLQNMLSLEKAVRVHEKGNSFLVSGGCDKVGKSPHLKNTGELQALSEKGRINIHSGLVTEKEAEKLSKLIDVVSFDLVLDQDIISRVYGFEVSAADYLNSYYSLKKYVPVVPHLCLGLKGGKIEREYEALEILQRENPEAVCFLVFTPTPGTLFAQCQPPSLQRTADFLAEARQKLPFTSLHLGCLRPGGSYRSALDAAALQIGLDKIVQPAPPARQKAADWGFDITWSEECCSL